MRRRDALVLDAVAGKRVGNGGWVRGDCPFCEQRKGTPDRKQCLGLEVATGKWHCFRCGTGGLVLEMPEELRPIGPGAAGGEEPAPEPIELPESFELLYEEPGWSAQSLEFYRDYLRGRGLDDDLCHDAKIGACTDGRARRRVVVPIYDARGEVLLGWSARATWKGAERKYLYPEGMKRAGLFYNAAALYEDTDEPLMVVEGVFDALPHWPDAVAALGKPGPSHLEVLLDVRVRRPIVSALDGDAWREAEALALRLSFEGKRAGSIRLPPATDPGVTPPDVMRRLAREALAA